MASETQRDPDRPGVEYIHADLHAAEIARLTRELEEVREKVETVTNTAMRLLSEGCDADHAGTMTFAEFVRAGGGACGVCLTRELEEVREALRPFAEVEEFGAIDGALDDEPVTIRSLTAGDFRRALVTHLTDKIEDDE